MNKEDINYKYKKLCPFKWFVLENFPFIEADFDALTNWELFCKLGNEINKVIKSTNSLGTQVEDLTDYVSNYFDNLDVQEEIDHKLDEMTKDGTLQEIITSYLNVKGVLGFNTLSELINATNIVDGSFCKTFGKDSLNDGNGNFYIIRTIKNTDVIDNINLIRINTSDTLVAELIKDNTIDNIINSINTINKTLNNKTNIDELKQKRLFSHFHTKGCFEDGVGLASICNDFGENRPQIMGITDVETLRKYTNRDSAGFYVGNQSPELLLDYQSNDTIFTQTSVQCPSMTEEQIKKIEDIDNIENLIIDTNGKGTGSAPVGVLAYTGLIQSFNKETKTFYIKEGFVPKPNIDDNFYTPNNGTGIYIGFCSKVWGENIIANLQQGSNATSVTGSEIDARNNRGDVTDGTVIDAVSSGDHEIQYGVKSRGKIQRSYYAETPSYAGYVMKSPKSQSVYYHLLLDENGDIVSYEKTTGAKSTLKNEIQVINNSNVAMSPLSGSYIITAQLENYQFLSPVSAGSGAIIFIFNVQNEFNVQYANGTGSTTSIQIRNGGTILISDGTFWNFIK